MDLAAYANDIFNYLVTNIMPLPMVIKGTGLAIIVLLVLRSIGQFLSFSWIKAATGLVIALVIALVMARYGQDIAGIIYDPAQNNGATNTQN